jgi:hypothetical protein
METGSAAGKRTHANRMVEQVTKAPHDGKTQPKTLGAIPFGVL